MEGLRPSYEEDANVKVLQRKGIFMQMLVFVTYKQYQYAAGGYVERTAIFAGKWAVQKELEKCEQEGNPMIITGMWCW